ncbi:helix-turn-helix domain-containing protein [Streptomyces axinellae]|uniref:TetR/AcrR family transcriptional regulator n=1 Tax=Streptomyces axinellae TaxID=552788 RepID=A0ABN3Q6A1_9ACTN
MAEGTHRARGMSEQRRRRLRLEISREASRLFWERGVAGTSGDRIAEAVGLSTRTIWRHFRSKESCAEPIVAQSVAWELAVLRNWPPHLSLEEHFATEINESARRASTADRLDTLLAMRMIRLADDEPSIRTAWLMACDQVEREMTAIIARRLGRPAATHDVRLAGAAASAAFRVINEDIGAAALSGVNPGGLTEVSARIAQAVRTATGGHIGDPVPPPLVNR